MKPRTVIAVSLALLLLAAAAWFRRPPAPSSSLAPPPTLRAERRGTLLALTAAERARRHLNREAEATVPATVVPRGNVPQATPAAATTNLDGWASGAAQEYRRRAQYPPWSSPIDESAEDPILRDREVSPNVSRGPDGSDPSLVAFPDQVSFEAPDAIVLYAFLSDNGVPVPASRITAEIRDAHGAVLAQVPMNDDGRDGDPRADDSVYAVQVGRQSIAARLDGAYNVVVHAVTVSGEDRFGTTGFLYSNPDAQLTGHYGDRLVDGNLQISAELEVSTAGRFYLAASLYSQDGRPLAWTQNALELEPGVAVIPLTFFGRILRQKSVDGPYVLRFVALSTTTSMPNAKNRLIENAFVTQRYAAADFSDQPFNDPNLLDTADRLENSRIHRGQAP